MSAWVKSHPHGSDVDEAKAWLHAKGYQQVVIDAILPILMKLWEDAWNAGTQSAESLTGGPGTAPHPQGLADFLKALGRAWATQIAGTTLALMAKLLAAGTVTVAALMALLSDPERASTIASTEITRAQGEAAVRVYQLRNHKHVQWVVQSGNPCASCLENEAAGRWPLGVPFPSGAMAPPEHVRCECALVPA